MTGVLHFIETVGPGGAESIFVEVAARVRDAGLRSVGLAREGSWAAAELRARGVPVVDIPRPALRPDWFGRVTRAIRRESIDVIHTHLHGGALYGGMAALWAGLPVVSTFHGQWDIKASEPRAWLKWALIRQSARRFVFVSDPLRAHFVAAGVVRDVETAVIPNGIDLAAHPQRRDDSLRRELGVGPDEVLVGAVGNIRPAKSYDVFLEVAARLVRGESGDRYRFVIVGDQNDDSYAALQPEVTRLGLGDRVFFTGYRSDVARVLGNLDVYLLTSSTEGFSLSLVQAMACGVPVVATRCGGPEIIVDDGRTGWLAPVGDVRALADRVAQEVAGGSRRADMVRAAREAVERRFSVEAMAGAYRGLYEAVRLGK